MEVKISSVESERDQFDDELNDLLDALVMAFGDTLPESIHGVSQGYGGFRLHTCSDDLESFGNAYGEVLAAHGWAIVGWSSDYITIRAIESCEKDISMMHTEGDEEKIVFESP